MSLLSFRDFLSRRADSGFRPESFRSGGATSTRSAEHGSITSPQGGTGATIGGMPEATCHCLPSTLSAYGLRLNVLESFVVSS
jgi:hypothetical protein